MATRLNYVLPIARQLVRSAGGRLRPGGLASRLAAIEDGRPFVIVTGAGRSGTSAVARVLHESGVSMGTEFDEPTEQNRAGFYEDTGMRAINQQILGDVGLEAMRRSPAWPWRSAVLAVAEKRREQMQEVASQAGGGWKDPLFAVTLEAWLPHLPRRTKLVLCLRSPEAFLHSVSRIYGLVSRDMIERRWASDFRRLLAIVRDYRLETTCVEYDELVQRPEEVVARLSAFVGHPLDAKYVEPQLRRHAYTVPPRHAALYQKVRAFAVGGVAPEQRPPLLSRLRGRRQLTEEERQAIDGYLERVRAVDAHLQEAKVEWSQVVGAPPLSSNGAGLIERAQSASVAYVAVLQEAQETLGALTPPVAFERYHEAARSYVNGERLVAQLTLQASERPQPEQPALDDVARAWNLLASPEAVAKAEQARSREHKRAMRTSGYGTE